MTIRTKLLAGFAGVFLPIALLCVVAITQLGASNGRLRTLYQARLVPTVQLSQIVDNLDQMRQIVTQYVLTTKGEESATVLRDGVLLEIDTLDTSITHAVDRYRAGMSDPDQQALLQRWPTAWDALGANRHTLLSLSAGTPRQQKEAMATLTTTFNDRLNTPLDLVYALMGAQQRQGYAAYQESEATYQRAFLVLVVGLIALATVSALFALGLARSIVQPLGRLTGAARRLAGGDTAVTADLPAARRDEIGALSASFQAMVVHQQRVAQAATAVAQGDLTCAITPQGPEDTLGHAVATMITNLQALVGHVVHSSDAVTLGAARLSATTERIGQAATHIAGAIEEVARGAGMQSESAAAAAGQMSSVGAATTEVAANAETQRQAAAQAMTTAREGSAAVAQTIASIAGVRDAVRTSAAQVHALGQRSAEIGQIVAAIDDIATQTNLLALNAAIEAARAGEHGKGFAVVAAEVRKLAERAGAETKGITARIGAIQAQVAEVMTAMDAGTREVEHTAVLGEQASGALQGILQGVDATTAQAEAIGRAVAHMQAGAARVHTAIESIAAVSEESAAGAEEVTASTHEQTASVQEVVAQTQELATLAAGLRAAAARFTVEEDADAPIHVMPASPAPRALRSA